MKIICEFNGKQVKCPVIEDIGRLKKIVIYQGNERIVNKCDGIYKPVIEKEQ